MRLLAGRVEYLVKWKGFDLRQASWEPPEALIDCSALLKEYHQSCSQMYPPSLSEAREEDDPPDLEEILLVVQSADE